MIKKILLNLLFFPLVLLAQEENVHEFPRLRWGIDVGVEMFDGSALKNPNIRESQPYYYDSYYYDDFYYNSLRDSYNYIRGYIGVKPEYSLNHHFAVAAGVRFSYNRSKLEPDYDCFLWKVSEKDLITNYVQINKISQNNFYAGIPLEIKCFTSKSDMLVRQYFKAGMLFNVLVASHNSVEFVNERMEKYADEINRQMGKPSSMSGYLYLGIGLKFGRMNYPFGSVEIQMPVSVFKDKKLASFIEEPAAGFGIQTTIYIPAGKNKLSYVYK